MGFAEMFIEGHWLITYLQKLVKNVLFFILNSKFIKQPKVFLSECLFLIGVLPGFEYIHLRYLTVSDCMKIRYILLAIQNGLWLMSNHLHILRIWPLRSSLIRILIRPA